MKEQEGSLLLLISNAHTHITTTAPASQPVSVPFPLTPIRAHFLPAISLSSASLMPSSSFLAQRHHHPKPLTLKQLKSPALSSTRTTIILIPIINTLILAVFLIFHPWLLLLPQMQSLPLLKRRHLLTASSILLSTTSTTLLSFSGAIRAPLPTFLPFGLRSPNTLALCSAQATYHAADAAPSRLIHRPLITLTLTLSLYGRHVIEMPRHLLRQNLALCIPQPTRQWPGRWQRRRHGRAICVVALCALVLMLALLSPVVQNW